MQISPSIRYTDFKHGDDYTHEFFDRRDLTGPSTALDRRLLSTRIDADYTEYDIGDYTDLGFGVMADFTWDNGLNVLLGARYDEIDISSRVVLDKVLLFNFSSEFVILSDDGQFLLIDFPPVVDPANPAPDDIKGRVVDSTTEDGVSWTASVSWATQAGIIPYVTASEQSTIIAGQGAQIPTHQIWSGSFDTSELLEFGIKGSFLDDTLYMALAVYEQERTDFSSQAIVTNTVNNTEGIEFETRWVANENLVMTFGYSHMEIVNLTVLNEGQRFGFFGAEDMPQIDPSLVYGSQVIGFNAAPNEAAARRAGVPENIYTFTGTYAFNNGFGINASVISADEAFSSHSQAVRLPSYTLLNLGVFYETERWTMSLTGKNLTDEKYFRANFPNLFGAQIVLPERPTSWQATVAFHF